MPITAARLRISQYSADRKSQADEKGHKMRQIALSLTSMVDMFAILVIFLLANSDSSQWVTLDHGINLPRAGYYDAPPRGVTLFVAQTAVFGENKNEVASMAAVNASKDAVELVVRYLEEQRKLAETTAREKAEKMGEPWPPTDEKAINPGTYVNIIADEKLPFGAIRRIVTSAQQAGFSTVNLATQPKS